MGYVPEEPYLYAHLSGVEYLVFGNYDRYRVNLPKKWDELVYRIGETIAYEKSYAAPYRRSTTQKLQGRDDDTWSLSLMAELLSP
jgi:hypothetical protein